MRCLAVGLLLVGAVSWSAAGEPGSWPQFRGAAGTARAAGEQKLPTEMGPQQHVLWKTDLPFGHSSPVVQGERVYLTAVRGQALLTLALDRKTGKILWEREAPHGPLEKIHRIGSYAQPTPTTDGERVVSFFGSAGLFCYDTRGTPLWNLPMGPFKNEFGAGSSPLLVGDYVILNQDHDSASFLMKVKKLTGEVVWKVNRSEFPVGYATPVISEVAGKKLVVVCGTLRIVGYDFDTGKEVWTVRGMSRVMNMTPSFGPDGTLYVAGWAAGADAGERFKVQPFAEMIARFDKNKNSTLELEELPAGPMKERFNQIDRDKSGHITEAEWEGMRRIFEAAQNRMVAIKPGGAGDITESHVLWSFSKQLPYVPSPLFCNDTLFLVKDGGIVTSLDARTGKLVKQERVRGTGSYYASPVAGDGKVYLVNQDGDVTVISAEPHWRVLATAELGELVYATPALVDGRIYLRTRSQLYCFGTEP